MLEQLIHPVAQLSLGKGGLTPFAGPILDIRHTDCNAPVRIVVECFTEPLTLTPGFAWWDAAP